MSSAATAFAAVACAVCAIVACGAAASCGVVAALAGAVCTARATVACGCACAAFGAVNAFGFAFGVAAALGGAACTVCATAAAAAVGSHRRGSSEPHWRAWDGLGNAAQEQSSRRAAQRLASLFRADVCDRKQNKKHCYCHKTNNTNNKQGFLKQTNRPDSAIQSQFVVSELTQENLASAALLSNVTHK